MAEFEKIARKGVRVLLGSCQHVRPGGLLVAITCSIDLADNEHVVSAFLERNQEFELLDLNGLLSPPIDRAIEAQGRWRLLPGGDHDGFTVHVMKRRED